MEFIIELSDKLSDCDIGDMALEIAKYANINRVNIVILYENENSKGDANQVKDRLINIVRQFKVTGNNNITYNVIKNNAAGYIANVISSTDISCQTGDPLSTNNDTQNEIVETIHVYLSSNEKIKDISEKLNIKINNNIIFHPYGEQPAVYKYQPYIKKKNSAWSPAGPNTTYTTSNSSRVATSVHYILLPSQEICAPNIMQLIEDNLYQLMRHVRESWNALDREGCLAYALSYNILELYNELLSFSIFYCSKVKPFFSREASKVSLDFKLFIFGVDTFIRKREQEKSLNIAFKDTIQRFVSDISDSDLNEAIDFSNYKYFKKYKIAQQSEETTVSNNLLSFFSRQADNLEQAFENKLVVKWSTYVSTQITIYAKTCRISDSIPFVGGMVRPDSIATATGSSGAEGLEKLKELQFYFLRSQAILYDYMSKAYLQYLEINTASEEINKDIREDSELFKRRVYQLMLIFYIRDSNISGNLRKYLHDAIVSMEAKVFPIHAGKEKENKIKIRAEQLGWKPGWLADFLGTASTFILNQLDVQYELVKKQLDARITPELSGIFNKKKNNTLIEEGVTPEQLYGGIFYQVVSLKYVLVGGKEFGGTLLPGYKEMTALEHLRSCEYILVNHLRPWFNQPIFAKQAANELGVEVTTQAVNELDVEAPAGSSLSI